MHGTDSIPAMRTLSASLPASTLRLGPLVLLALLACYVVWGSTYFAIRVALASFPPFFQMGTRFLVAGALLMAWVLWRARRGGPGPPAARTRSR